MRLSATQATAGRSGAPPLGVPASRRGRATWPAAVAAALAVLPALVAGLLPAIADAWQLDRVSLAAGELWRVVTCHWSHWTLEHLVWDTFALGLLTFLCWERCPRRCLASVAASAATIPLVVLAAMPELTSYRGLSGIDSALYALLAVVLVHEGLAVRRPLQAAVAALALLAFAAKIAFEATTGGAVFAASGGFTPAPLAHLVGAVIGVACAFLPQRRRHGRSSPLL